MIKIREASVKDLDALQRFSPELRADEEPLKREIARLLKKRNFLFLIAEDGKKPIGFLNASIHNPPHLPKGFGVINGIFVEQAYRGKGIGKKLMEKGLNWLKSRKAWCCQLYSDFDNTLAHKLWKELGFKKNYVGFKKELK